MARPTTIRLPEQLLSELDRRARAHGKDRATFMRELLRDALARDLRDEVLADYAAGHLSFNDASQRLGVDTWGFHDLLRREGLRLNVTLEDWIDSSQAI